MAIKVALYLWSEEWEALRVCRRHPIDLDTKLTLWRETKQKSEFEQRDLTKMQSSSVSPASSLTSSSISDAGNGQIEQKLMSMYDFDAATNAQTGRYSVWWNWYKPLVIDSCGEVNQLGGVFVNGRPLPNGIRQKVRTTVDLCSHSFSWYALRTHQLLTFCGSLINHTSLC